MIQWPSFLALFPALSFAASISKAVGVTRQKSLLLQLGSTSGMHLTLQLLEPTGEHIDQSNCLLCILVGTTHCLSAAGHCPSH